MVRTMTRPTRSTTPAEPPASPADRIQQFTRGFRLSFSGSGFGGSRKVGTGVTANLAEQYEASAEQLTVSKKLLNAGHPAVKKYNEHKNAINSFFSSKTLSSPRPGVRLLRLHGKTEEERNRETNDFLTRLGELRDEYNFAVEQLSNPATWASVVDQMREKLGKLFREDDYPTATQLRTMLTAEIMPEDIGLPEYYKQLAPQEYERAAAQVQARFQAVVDLQEQELVKGLQKLVDDFRERVTTYHDGGSKRFTDSVVTNVKDLLTEFQEKCKGLGIGEGGIEEQLNKVVELLSKDRHGNKLDFSGMAQELRDDESLSRSLVAKMGEVSANLAALATNAPRRQIIRQAQQAATGE